MLLLGATASPLAPFAAVDGAVLDAFIRLAPPRAAAPRLLLVTIDEATLHSDATPLSARGDAAGILLERAFSAGAAGVALDLLL
ncbi:CHASE2 domain-containing protein, partial [Citrobacter sp. AAK_AS5]